MVKPQYKLSLETAKMYLGVHRTQRIESIPLSEVRLFDGFVSYRRKPFLSNPVEWFFNELLLRKSKKRWPQGAHNANHVVCDTGEIQGVHTDFEWTFPTARHREFEDWRVDPEVALVVRPKKAESVVDWNDPDAVAELQKEVFRWCLKNNGMWYDAMQTAGIYFGNKKMIFGGKYHVCSTGYRATVERFCGKIDMKYGLWETIPCDLLNEPEHFKVFAVDMEGGTK